MTSPLAAINVQRLPKASSNYLIPSHVHSLAHSTAILPGGGERFVAILPLCAKNSFEENCQMICFHRNILIALSTFNLRKHQNLLSRRRLDVHAVGRVHTGQALGKRLFFEVVNCAFDIIHDQFVSCPQNRTLFHFDNDQALSRGRSPVEKSMFFSTTATIEQTALSTWPSFHCQTGRHAQRGASTFCPGK